MKNKIDFFLAWTESDELRKTAALLANSGVVNHLYVVTSARDEEELDVADHVSVLHADNVTGTKFFRQVASRAKADYVALYLKPQPLTLGYRCLERLCQAAEDAAAVMVYADHYSVKNGEREMSPKIAYQEGSVRDDFDFGGLILMRTSALKSFFELDKVGRYRYAAMYALRLHLSRVGQLFHLNEYLYTEVESDLRKSGEKQFDYVNPKNREVQLENERASTDHLKRIGAYLAPDEFDDLPHDDTPYPVEASVIIPVRNRVRTIRDAVESVLSQEADFAYNIIVVDNHSDDGTTEVLREWATDERVVHLIPEQNDLGIGGCWDLAIRSEHCGRYAVQ